MSEEVMMELDETKTEEPVDVSEMSYEEKLQLVNAIAKPIASKKLAKKIYKCIKKGKLFFFIIII